MSINMALINLNAGRFSRSTLPDDACLKASGAKVPGIVHAEDIHILLDFVLDNSHFEVNGFLFRQLRGVAMGSPAAPPLCNFVATVEDYFWHHTMHTLRVNIHRFGIVWHQRYVDNRFILIQHPLSVSPYVQQFMSLEFYGPPVLLETQHDDKVLGYRCNSTLRTVTPQLPELSSQLKSLRSASEAIYSTSSWLSRCWLIRRGTCPCHLQDQALHALRQIYTDKGFEAHQLPDLKLSVSCTNLRTEWTYILHSG